MQESINDNIELLLFQYFEKELPPYRVSEVENWINSSPENLKVSEEVYSIFLATKALKTKHDVDTERAYKKVESKINRHILHRINNCLIRLAAVLFIPLLITTFFITNKSECSSRQMISLKTLPGMTAKATLPDGTIVSLNSGSTLSYPSVFNGSLRQVSMSGEIYFKVKKDTKPFIVSLPHNSQIEVLGTSFNVDAYKQRPMITTTLVEGKINFSSKSKEDSQNVILRCNKRLIYNSNTHTISVNKTSCRSETAWTNGQIILESTPFEEVLYILEKRYNVSFVVKDKSLYRNVFTGTFYNQNIEEILDYFRISSKIHWECAESSNNGKKTIVIY